MPYLNTIKSSEMNSFEDRERKGGEERSPPPRTRASPQKTERNATIMLQETVDPEETAIVAKEKGSKFSQRKN